MVPKRDLLYLRDPDTVTGYMLLPPFPNDKLINSHGISGAAPACFASQAASVRR